MKPRKLKKLTLNKTTVAHLNTGSLRAAKGGIENTWPGSTCKCTPPRICGDTGDCSADCTVSVVGCETHDGGNTCIDVSCHCATAADEYSCQSVCPYVTCN